MNSPNRYPVLFLIIAFFAGADVRADVNVVVTSDYEIDLTDREEAEIFEAPRNLVRTPSELLDQGMRAGGGSATVVDQRGVASVEYPLLVIIVYEMVELGDHRSVRPAVQCKGTLYPIIWSVCDERTETYLRLPEFGRFQIDPGTITRSEAESILARMDLSYGRSETVRLIEVQKLRLRPDGQLYEVRGKSDKGSFTALIRPNRDD